MEILGIKLKNFLSHVDTEINFSDSAPYLFIGPNGAGKSSAIKDSITWVLFGESRAKGAGDDLIYDNEKKVTGEVRLKVNNDTYRIVRDRERGKKTDLSLFKLVDGVYKDISNVTMGRTQQDVEKILGFNYQIFAVSACLEQNSRLNFSELTPKECKDTIMQILEIDKYNDYEKIAREKSSSLETEIREIENRIGVNTEKIKKYSESKDSLSQFKASLVSLNEQKEIRIEEIKTIEEAIKLKVNEIESKISGYQNRVEELRVLYKAKESESLEFAKDISVSGAEINRLTQKILKIKKLGNKCPTCELEIEGNHIDKLLLDTQNELKQQEKLQKEITPKFEKAQTDIEKIETEGKSFKILENQKELKGLNESLVELANDKVLQTLKDSIQGIEKSVQFYKQEVTNEEELMTEIKVDKEKIGTIKVQVEEYAVLQHAFGKSGIPAMIISNITNELEISTNAILRELTNKNIAVKVATEKNLKAKDELVDTLQIVIRNGLLERPYQLYSGGEKYRIDLAIRLALSKILARRNNFRLETLIIDEPAGLDKDGLVSFKDTLYRLSKLFKKIFVVSHLTELIDDTQGRFKIVEVKNNNGVSFVKNT